LTIFPHGMVCDPSSTNEQLTPIKPMSDMDPDLKSWAAGINAQIHMQGVGGGTPTGLSLSFVGGLPELNDPKREDFVLLLTDGLPNCNPSNPNTCTTPAACNCTLS